MNHLHVELMHSKPDIHGSIKQDSLYDRLKKHTLPSQYL